MRKVLGGGGGGGGSRDLLDGSSMKYKYQILHLQAGQQRIS